MSEELPDINKALEIMLNYWFLDDPTPAQTRQAIRACCLVTFCYHRGMAQAFDEIRKAQAQIEDVINPIPEIGAVQ